MCWHQLTECMCKWLCLMISHSNESWPRKSEQHRWKNSLNYSLSTTCSAEPHRTAANRTGKVAEACTSRSGSVCVPFDWGWSWNQKRKIPQMFFCDHSTLEVSILNFFSDIVDIKPANMEDLTEVITSAEFHPHHCHLFVYSSSKGTLRLCDMRASALCDRHTKCEHLLLILCECSRYKKSSFLLSSVSIWRTWRSGQQILLLRDHFLRVGRQVQPQWTLPIDQRLPHRQGVGPQHGQGSSGDISGEVAEPCCCLRCHSF